MKTKNNQEMQAEKQSGKIKRIFAIIYFITTIASLIFYTISSAKYVVNEGWTAVNIIMTAFIGLSYLILIACIVLSKNVAVAKTTHSKAKKMLKYGKKTIKIAHAVPTIMILFATTPTGIFDTITRIMSVLSFITHVIGLISSINMLITKMIVKKVAKKGKEKLTSKIDGIKNKKELQSEEVMPLADSDEE